ncbi:MAG TPA: hypothetical protein VI485_10950 [Vicinamibacterales bacterium]|nr:hypothetical protein [Vicinamibacterales bacterium]
MSAAALVVSVPGAAGQSGPADDTLTSIGDYVAQYYARAQSIVSEETVTIQRLGRDLMFDGFARRLVYELRVEWNPTAIGDDSPATVTRQLLTVNGRPPRPRDKRECMDPRNVSPEPLAFLLPDRRHKYRFTAAGVGRVDGRAAVMVDYRSLEVGEPKTEWSDECVNIELPGRARGRVWADPATSRILRVDEQLTGMVDIPVPPKQQRVGAPMFMTIERADTSILYREVTFRDPDETLLLPATVESLAIVRNSGSPRVRITQSFSNYRRFVTGSRIVP